jgi:ABC-type phosphate transport system substrate-binding protein
MRTARFLTLTLASVVLLARPALGQKVQINGAGATFPYPIYSKWFSEYNKLHPEIEINYQSIGSGGGIRQVTNQTVFFGASDGPMTAEQLQAAPGKILHFPSVLGADVPVYNIPGVDAELKFTGPVLADIFLGKITKWNDRQAESRSQASRDGHHGLPPFRRLRDDVHLGGLPLQGVSRVEKESRRGDLRQLAGRHRRQGK